MLLEILRIFLTSNLLSILVLKIFQIRKTILVQVKVDIALVASLIRTKVILIIAIVIFLSLF